eukprot:TRINITY_DN15279_c0_g1_i1.p2 TRINITY_DN15279_c0_g1~~TRINITY_DN15279_c0_g1_i1.p2  ORF type:complete len:66 (-),score=2.91 TRINITY_DN15279_c0_g1_i1:93-290(-)
MGFLESESPVQGKFDGVILPILIHRFSATFLPLTRILHESESKSMPSIWRVTVIFTRCDTLEPVL